MLEQGINKYQVAADILINIVKPYHNKYGIFVDAVYLKKIVDLKTEGLLNNNGVKELISHWYNCLQNGEYLRSS